MAHNPQSFGVWPLRPLVVDDPNIVAHGNTFSRPIPENIGELTSLKDLYGDGKSN